MNLANPVFSLLRKTDPLGRVPNPRGIEHGRDVHTWKKPTGSASGGAFSLHEVLLLDRRRSKDVLSLGTVFDPKNNAHVSSGILS